MSSRAETSRFHTSDTMNTVSRVSAPRPHSRILLYWQAALCVAVIAVNPQTSACAATLADLFNGGSITAGNARFDNWELVSVDATSSTLPNFAQINVVPLVSDPAKPGVQIQGNGQLTTTGLNALDINLRFRVSALSGGNAFTGHELNLSSVAFGDLTGRAIVSHELALPGNNLGSGVTIVDNDSGISRPLSSGNFAPQPSFMTNVNLFLNGLTSTINLAAYSHSFSQTGPTTTPGDYNLDGNVDAADYAVWRKNPEAFGGNVAGYDTWRTNFGATFGSGSNALQPPSAVPEPTSALLLLSIAAVGAWRHRRFALSNCVTQRVSIAAKCCKI